MENNDEKRRVPDEKPGVPVVKTSCPSRVQSLCPVCGKIARATYAKRGEAVFFDIVCDAHGTFSTLASEDADDFGAWMRWPSTTVAPRVAITRGVNAKVDSDDASERSPASECPLHCGVCDDHLMTACCVLLDVTERCNQHCPWCFAHADEDPARDPSLATVERWYDRLLALGEARPFNIQLSGGEPTVRNDLPDIIRMGKAKGFDYIQLNTNGRRLGDETGFARALKDAGLTTVFMQFDGTSDAIYEALRGESLLHTKMKAIEACGDAGLPVTLVPTIVQGVNTSEIGALVNFMLERLGVIKGIHFQPASFFGRHPGGTNASEPNRVTMFAVMDALERQTGGIIKKSDLLPITTGHPLCCFCANFMRKRDGGIMPVISDTQREEGMACCDAAACCESGAVPDPLDVIRRDRDFVLNKWTVGANLDEARGSRDCASPPDPAGDGVMSFDEALTWFRGNMFTLSGMAFMDRANLDAERLKRCRVQVFTPDERLVPFCAWNALYRTHEAPEA